MSYSNGGSHSRTPEPLYGPNSTGAGPAPGQTTPLPPKAQPLLCSGHTRPVVHLQFSNMYVGPLPSTEQVAYHISRLTDGTYQLISACKDGNPMLRSWIGDWIGTFLGTLTSLFRKCKLTIPGHKGAVWSTKLSLDASRAVTGSADFSA